MSDARRRVVRLSIFLLPALLLLAALYVFRGDLRASAASFMVPRYTQDGLTLIMKGRNRAEPLGEWLRGEIASLKKRDQIYRFTLPKAGFQVEVQSEPGPSYCDPGSNRIVIRGIPDDAPWERIQPDLSRLVVRAMLREGAPDAEYSPWFEEGVSTYYEGSKMIGSRKVEPIRSAARNAPKSLAEALAARGGAYFSDVSHSIVAFLHEAFTADIIARYAEIERAPGSIPLGEFQRIFGHDVEGAWREYLERRQNGS